MFAEGVEESAFGFEEHRARGNILHIIYTTINLNTQIVRKYYP